MQSTSNVWQSLWQSGSARLEARATIGGTVYGGISAPVLSRATMGSGLGAGNAVSASCAFSLRTSDAIPKAAAVAVETRLTDGTTSSEWLPTGTFYISKRACDPVTGRLSLECYDALLKANAVWTPSAGGWPRAMTAVAAELAALLGVQQDSRNVIHTGNDYRISQPGAGATVRDVLCQIGAAHGGNWIITPANRLRLVPVVNTGDAVTVAGVLGRMDAGAAGTISGIRCAVDGQTFLTGDETGAVLSLTGGLPAWGPLLEDDVIGARWQPFQLSGAVYDPAAELGDIITAGANGEVSGPLCRETVTLGALPRGDIAAPGTEEAADEYPYIGQAAKTLAVAKAYADDVSAAAADALDSALTQLEIFNRLTGNGAAQGLFLVNGQLYVNASYINTGELAATLIHGGTLTLGGANDVNGVLQVLDANGNAIVTLDNTGAEITDGSIVSYNADRTTRTLITSGKVLLQCYVQHPGSGQMIWSDFADISVNDTGKVLNLYGLNGISLSSAPDSFVGYLERANLSIKYGNGFVLEHERTGSDPGDAVLSASYANGLSFTHTYGYFGQKLTVTGHYLGGFTIKVEDPLSSQTTTLKVTASGVTVNGNLTVTGTIHN